MLDVGVSLSGAAIINAISHAAPPFSPPAGYRWEITTENGFVVIENNEPVLELVRIAA